MPASARSRALLAAAVIAVAAAGLLLSGEVPQWRADGTRSVAMMSVGVAPSGDLCPPAGGRVHLRGDSHVTGARVDEDGRAAPAYGAVLQEALGRGVTVLAAGRGGATAAAGEAAWQPIRPAGGLVLIAYGTNDAAVRGPLGGKSPVPLPAFRRSLGRLIARVRQEGGTPALIAPPPPGSPAMAERLQPYRAAVAAVGRETGVAVFDLADAFAGCAGAEPLLIRDALHLNARGHACVGRWLARRLCG